MTRALKIWTIVRSCPDYRAYKKAYVQIFVRFCSGNVFLMYLFQVQIS